MTASATLTIQETKPLTILQRLAEKDKTAVADCVDRYGNLIWVMAKNLTDSSEDAENVVREIFLDIWRSAVKLDSTDFDELLFITILARRQLIEKCNR